MTPPCASTDALKLLKSVSRMRISRTSCATVVPFMNVTGTAPPGTGVAREHKLIPGVDGIHGEVGDGDVHRDTHAHDRRHTEVAEHRVEIRTSHRPQAVDPTEHEVAWILIDLGHQSRR